MPETKQYRYRRPDGHKGVMWLTPEAAATLRLGGWFVRAVPVRT